ncbi:MAG: ABC transporter substrate-binding protein [Caldilineaceae bacterium]
MLRNKQVLGILGLIAVFAMILSGCVAPTAAPAAPAEEAAAPAEEAAAEAPAEGEPIDVALIYGVAGDGFYVTMEAGATAKAEEMGINFTAQGPAQFDAVLQRPILDAVVATAPDAICIAATDKNALTEPMKAAHDAGIHIFSVDTFIGDTAGDYTTGDITFPLSYIGSDNVQGGKIACEAVIEAMGGTGKMYIQNVRPGISTTDQREQGCREAIEATGGAVELVGVDYNEDSAATAAEQTAAVLQRVPDLGGVFGANLFSAEGAATAVKNAGLTGVVKIAAFDAPEAAIEDLRNEVVDLVIAQLPYEMGQKCIEYAHHAVMGEMELIDKRWPTGYQVITRDNVDTPESQNAIYKSE